MALEENLDVVLRDPHLPKPKSPEVFLSLEKVMDRLSQVEVKEVERFEEFRHARQAKEGEDKGSVPSLSVARLSFFLPLNALSSCASRFGTCSRRALSGEGRASEHTSDAARGRGGGDSLDAANEKKASRVVLAKRRIRQPILSRLLSTHNSLPILTSCTGARAEHACAGS